MKWLPIGIAVVVLGAFLFLVVGGEPGERTDRDRETRSGIHEPTPDPARETAAPLVEAERAANTADGRESPFADSDVVPTETGRGFLAGRVVDEEGAPLADVIVSAHPGDNEHAVSWPRFLDPFTGKPRDEGRQAAAADQEKRAQSDADGRFRIADVPSGARYALQLHREDRAPLRRGMFPSWTNRTTDCGTFTLGVGALIEGVVVDDLGNPIAGATVGTITRGATPPVATDLAGRFRLGGLEPGTHRLGASADNHVGLGAFARLAVDVAVGETKSDVRIELPRASSISGRVVDETGAPYEDAYAVARRAASLNATAETSADGRYVIDGLAKGVPYKVSAGDWAIQSAAEPIEVTPPAVNVDLVLPRPPSVVLTAIDAATGEPVDLAGCRWAEDGDTRTFESGGNMKSAGGRGRYRIPAPPSGTYRLLVAADGYEPTQSELVATNGLTELAPITIVLRRLSTLQGFFGVVRRAADRTPVANAAVLFGPWKTGYARVVHGVPVTESPVSMRGRPTRTDADGTFSLPRPPEEDHFIRIVYPDHAARMLPAADLSAGTADDPYEILLEPGGRLEGTVLDFDGHPKHDLPVVLYRSDDATSVTRTGPDGRYAFSAITPGRWSCVPGEAYAEPTSTRPSEGEHVAFFETLRTNHPTVRIEADRTARLDLDLRTLGGAVRGNLLVDGLPKKSHRVWLRPASLVDSLPHVGALLAWTGHDGDFEFTAIPSGAYLLAATTDRLAVQLVEATVRLTRGRVERVELAVVTGRLAGVVRVVGRADVPGGSVHVRTEKIRSPNGARLSVARSSIAEDGTFEVTGVPPGSYVAVASIPKIGEQTRPVVITAGRTAQAAFLLDLPGRIVVTFEGLAPEVDPVAVVLERDGEEIDRGVLFREADGRLFVEGVAPGSMRLAVSTLRLGDSGMQTQEFTATDVVVQRGETTEVRLVAAERE